MARCLQYDNENGNTDLTEGSVLSTACLLSSEHLALVSTSVSKQGRLFSALVVPPPPPLSCAWSCPQTLWTLRCCLWRSLSRQAVLYSLSALEAKGLVSCVVHTTASFLQNLIELPTVWNDVLQLFIDLGLQTFGVFFEECINQRDWHQRAFHWVPKKTEPLKIARLCCNELL